MNLRTSVRGKVFAAAGIATLVLTAAGASPAQAAGTCTLQQPPTKVRIAAPTTNLTLRIGSDCAAAGVTDASWVASAGGYDEEHFDFVPETSVTWHLGASYNWGYPRNFYWRALGAPTSAGDTATQNEPADTKALLGTGAALYGSRSGTEVRLTTSSSIYEPDPGRWIRYGGVRGTIQYWGTNGWTNMKYAYQDSNGYFTYRFHPGTRRSYRVVFSEGPSTWSSVSNTLYL